MGISLWSLASSRECEVLGMIWGVGFEFGGLD